MELIARSGLRGVELGAFADALARDGAAGLVGLSFDDGYLDVAENALPVLREHGFTATVFVATGVTDGRARFDWYEEQPPLIAWEEIERLDGETLFFEAHTVTHPSLLGLEDAEAREEIAGSKRILEERLGRRVRGFCYPAGLFGSRELALVGEAGFDYAASCEPGRNGPATDPLALRRIQVDHRDSLLDVRAKLGGGHDTPPPLRAAYRRLRYGASSRS